MKQRLLSIEEFNELLQKWNDQQIKIVKQEMDDIDEILLVLRGVSFTKGQSIDDYISRYALQLNGSGLIETTMDNYESLPAETFEIPLEEEATYEFDGARFTISTSRGVYTIEQNQFV